MLDLIRHLILLVLMVVAPAFLNGCKTSLPLPPPETKTFTNGNLQCEVVDPASKMNRNILGCRFMAAGWITGLKLDGTDQDIFLRDSIWPCYPAFGCPQEFIPAIPLSAPIHGYRRSLKIGVGIIDHSPKDPLHARIVRRFPWSGSVKQNSEWTVFEAIQPSGKDIAPSGYGYTLTQRVKIARNSQCIMLEQILDNTGSKELKLQNYLHPFFPGASQSGFKLHKFYKIIDITGDRIFTAKQLGAQCRKVEIKLSKKLQMIISSNRYFSSLKLWHESKLDLFAVEPYLTIKVKAGKSYKWYWILNLKIDEHKN